MDQVSNLLEDNKLQYTISGKDYVIKCLNPDHVDTNPSLRINKVSGVGHCFACGFKINLFKYYNKNSNYIEVRLHQLKEKIAKINSSTIGLKIPHGIEPFTREFRNISGLTYKTFKAFTHKDFEDRIVFPMYDVTGKIVAFNGRHIVSSFKPRYKIFPSGVELPLFPGKLKHINGTIVMVEGIFDVLNLYDKGLHNVVGILGVTTLHSKKGLDRDKVTLLKLQGITKIYLMLDPDDAGIRAMNELKPLLEAENFIVDTIELPEDKDPGDLTIDEVSRIINYIK